MPFELPALPYDYDALEPTIDAKTMEIHHDKHHQAYVTNLNAALEGTDWADRSIEDVIQNLDSIPEDKRAAVRNNGGGHSNHSLFWTIMQPRGGGDPSGALEAAINDAFGDPDQLKAQMNDAGVKRFGSGWTWLVRRRRLACDRLDAEPGQPADGGQDADPRDRRVGARLLPQVPEPASRLPRGLVGRRQLGRGRRNGTTPRAAEPASPPADRAAENRVRAPSEGMADGIGVSDP